MLQRWRARTLPSSFPNMSSSELGFSAARNPRSSAVSRIRAHDLRVNASDKGENSFLVLAATFAGTGAVLFPHNISRAQHGSFLCRRCGLIARNCDLFAPTLMAPGGHAHLRPLVYLSFMAGDDVDCLRKGENRPPFPSNALTGASPQSSFLTNSLYSPQAFFSFLRLTSRL